MKEETFYFTFSDKQQEDTSYDATYCLDNRRLEVHIWELIIEEKKEKSVRKLLAKHKGWQVFYDNASFEDILKEMRYKGNLTDYLEEINNIKKAEEQDLLEQVGNAPCLLDDADIRHRFIDIVKAARWGTAKKRKSAIKLLESHFLPKHPKGRTPFPKPLELMPARTIMQLLAKHLSKRCKTALVEEGYEIKDAMADDGWKDTYDILKKWAKNNEDRICSIPAEDLRTLISNPAVYADDRIEAHVNASIKTLKRRRQIKKANIDN